MVAADVQRNGQILILEIQQNEIANVLTVRNAGRGEIKYKSVDFDLTNSVNGVPCTAMDNGK